MEHLELAVPTLFGLEGLCADELRRLGLPNVRAENGRVLCAAAPADIPRVNLNLRTGERALILLGSFPAGDFDALFEGVRALPWEDFLPRDAAFPVKGHCLNSALHAVPACQSIVKKAVAARLGARYGLEQLPETGPLYQIQFAIMKDTASLYLDTTGAGLHKRGYRAVLGARYGLEQLPETGPLYQIQFAIMKDTASLYLDTTGAGLHKRGYRAVGVVAPLRETLAAAMVMLSRYRGRDPFCDPFCGSGTIAIEAALIAKNRAPGLDRSFSAQKWGFVPASAWMEAADEAMDKEFDGDYDIWGGDIDPKAVAIARSNAEKAGVEDLVRFEVADALTFHREEPYGKLVTNPPYGERIMEKREAEELYRGFGRAFRAMPEGWTLSLLSSHTEFERTFGRNADRKRKLYNGMLKCDLFLYGTFRAMPEGWTLSLLSSHTEFERTFGRNADRKRKLYNGMLKCDLFLYGKRGAHHETKR